MERPHVEELHIENYGCIREAAFRMTPLHALIGPNDSGKSTVLRALRTLVRVNRELAGEAVEVYDPQKALQAIQGDRKPRLTATSRGVTWDMQVPRPVPKAVAQVLSGAQLLRLDPDALRTPRPLIQDGQPLRFEDERGTGLPAIYDAILVRDIQAFLELNAEVSKLFPQVKAISLTNPSPALKAMGIKLVDGTFVPAELMSEGLLYYLAFAALRYMEPTALLLIEEPENGLHPARIAEVMRVLREISKRMQVVIATHSPLVVNELQPDEVTVVTRSAEQGTKATLLKDTPHFEERAKVYALGELWLSYANGQDEAPLLEGGPRT